MSNFNKNIIPVILLVVGIISILPSRVMVMGTALLDTSDQYKIPSYDDYEITTDTTLTTPSSTTQSPPEFSPIPSISPFLPTPFNVTASLSQPVNISIFPFPPEQIDTPVKSYNNLAEKLSQILGPLESPEPLTSDNNEPTLRDRSYYGIQSQPCNLEPHLYQQVKRAMYDTIEELASVNSKVDNGFTELRRFFYALDNRITRLIREGFAPMGTQNRKMAEDILVVNSRINTSVEKLRQESGLKFLEVENQRLDMVQQKGGLERKLELTTMVWEKQFNEMQNKYEKLKRDTEITFEQHLRLINSLQKINVNKGPTQTLPPNGMDWSNGEGSVGESSLDDLILSMDQTHRMT